MPQGCRLAKEVAFPEAQCRSGEGLYAPVPPWLWGNLMSLALRDSHQKHRSQSLPGAWESRALPLL